MTRENIVGVANGLPGPYKTVHFLITVTQWVKGCSTTLSFTKDKIRSFIDPLLVGKFHITPDINLKAILNNRKK